MDDTIFIANICQPLAGLYPLYPHILSIPCFILSFIFKKKFKNLILERGEGREKEMERNIDVRKKCQLAAFLYVPQPGTKPTAQACALTGDGTGDLLLCGMKPNQLSHTDQGYFKFY